MDSRLVIGSGGVFEIAVDGEVVAQRRAWHFPSDEEVVAAVKKALEPGS